MSEDKQIATLTDAQILDRAKRAVKAYIKLLDNQIETNLDYACENTTNTEDIHATEYMTKQLEAASVQMQTTLVLHHLLLVLDGEPSRLMQFQEDSAPEVAS